MSVPGSENSWPRPYLYGACSSKNNLVHPVDKHSRKSILLPPTPEDLAKLVELARKVQPSSSSIVEQKPQVRSLKRRLTAEQVKELVNRYNAGEDTPALSGEFGISRTGLRQLLLAEGVSFRRQSVTAEDADRAVRLYESGLTIKEVVEEVGYSCNTVRGVLHKRGVAMRPACRRRPST